MRIGYADRLVFASYLIISYIRISNKREHKWAMLTRIAVSVHLGKFGVKELSQVAELLIYVTLFETG